MKKFLAVFLTIMVSVMALVSCSVVNTDVEGEIEQKVDIIKPEKVTVSDFDDLLKKKTQAGKSLENLSADVVCVIDLEAMEEAERIENNIQMKLDVKNMVYHTVTSTMGSQYDEPAVTETYSDKNATYTKDFTDEWYKHTTDTETVEQINKLLENVQSIDLDVSKYISDGVFEETTFGEKECYKVTYNLNLKLFDILSDIGIQESDLEELKTSLSEELGPELAVIIYDMLSDLGTVTVVEYLDAYTLYTVSAEIDMAQVLSDLVNEFIEVVISAYGEGMTAEDLGLNIAINEFSIAMTCDGFNTTEVVIPEEVLAAPEFTDAYIGEYDGETDILLEDEFAA